MRGIYLYPTFIWSAVVGCAIISSCKSQPSEAVTKNDVQTENLTTETTNLLEQSAETGEKLTVSGHSLRVGIVDTKTVIVAPGDATDPGILNDMGGFVDLLGITTAPLTFQRSDKYDALVATLPEPVANFTPAVINLFYRSSKSQRFEMDLGKLNASTLASRSRVFDSTNSTITTVGLELEIDGIKTMLAATGQNLDYAHLYIKSSGTEVEIPADLRGTTFTAVTSVEQNNILPNEVLTVIVRAPGFESIIPNVMPPPGKFELAKAREALANLGYAVSDSQSQEVFLSRLMDFKLTSKAYVDCLPPIDKAEKLRIYQALEDRLLSISQSDSPNDNGAILVIIENEYAPKIFPTP